MNDRLPAMQRGNPHHLTRRQVLLAFGSMGALVAFGYLIIEWSLRKERRKRGQPMWDGKTQPVPKPKGGGGS